ncbi:MAG: pseudouridine synthase [bacterium]
MLGRRDGLLAVDKPAGWLTHADGATDRPDVVGFLGDGVGVHMRLDVDTTGVLVFSTDPAAARRLQAAFEDRTARKRYLAVVEGSPPADEGVLEGPVPRAPGRPATTRYRVRRRGDGWTLIDVRPETGRTHQIRAHLAAAGCPLRGDGLYGDPLDLRAPRVLLHCARVDLGDVRFEAPPPPDFARYLGHPPAATRAGLLADAGTTCYRLVHGVADGFPGVDVDRYGDWLLVHQPPAPPAPAPAGPRRVSA